MPNHRQHIADAHETGVSDAKSYEKVGPARLHDREGALARQISPLIFVISIDMNSWIISNDDKESRLKTIVPSPATKKHRQKRRGLA